jgi:hypothetical protein
VTEADLKSAAWRLGQYIQEKAKALEAQPKRDEEIRSSALFSD